MYDVVYKSSAKKHFRVDIRCHVDVILSVTYLYLS